MFTWLKNLLSVVSKSASSLEDLADVAKATSTELKVDKMNELKDKLKEQNMADVHEFYEQLYK